MYDRYKYQSFLHFLIGSGIKTTLQVFSTSTARGRSDAAGLTSVILKVKHGQRQHVHSTNTVQLCGNWTAHAQGFGMYLTLYGFS